MAEMRQDLGVRPTFRKSQENAKDPIFFTDDPIEIYSPLESKWLLTKVTIGEYLDMTEWEAMYLEHIRINHKGYYRQLVKEGTLLQTVKRQGEWMQRTYEQQLPGVGEAGAREMAMDLMY